MAAAKGSGASTCAKTIVPPSPIARLKRRVQSDGWQRVWKWARCCKAVTAEPIISDASWDDLALRSGAALEPTGSLIASSVNVPWTRTKERVRQAPKIDARIGQTQPTRTPPPLWPLGMGWTSASLGGVHIG